MDHRPTDTPQPASVASHRDVERAIDALTDRLERIERGRGYRWHRRWRMLLRRLHIRR